MHEKILRRCQGDAARGIQSGASHLEVVEHSTWLAHVGPGDADALVQLHLARRLVATPEFHNRVNYQEM